MRRVFDAHVDTLMRIRGPGQYLEGTEGTQLDMPRAEGAGVTHLLTAICSEAEKNPREAFRRAYSIFLDVRHRSSIKLHLMLEGCQQLMDHEDRDNVEGNMSVASLTWNGSNSLGGGIGTDQGLTGTGRALARELHRRGILLDVSHLCDRSRKELMSLDIPVAATHCNCRSLHDCPRNLPDEDLRRIASGGGVVGITFVPCFLGGRGTMEDIVHHLEHLVEVAGIECAGFGSDFDGVPALPEGIRDCTSWPLIFEMLDRRGWTAADIDRVSIGNWTRVIN